MPQPDPCGCPCAHMGCSYPFSSANSQTLTQELCQLPSQASRNSFTRICGKCSLAHGDVTNKDSGKGASAFLLRLCVLLSGRLLQSWASVAGPLGALVASLTWRWVQDVAEPEGRCGVGGSELEGAVPGWWEAGRG